MKFIQLVMKSLIFLCSITLHASVTAEPLLIGGDAEMDACSGIASIKAKNFIYLRSAPELTAEPLGNILAGEQVYVCSEKGKWLGVIVIDSETGECGVSSPIASPMTYTGPCRWGWIEHRQIEWLAG